MKEKRPFDETSFFSPTTSLSIQLYRNKKFFFLFCTLTHVLVLECVEAHNTHSRWLRCVWKHNLLHRVIVTLAGIRTHHNRSAAFSSVTTRKGRRGLRRLTWFPFRKPKGCEPPHTWLRWNIVLDVEDCVIWVLLLRICDDCSFPTECLKCWGDEKGTF